MRHTTTVCVTSEPAREPGARSTLEGPPERAFAQRPKRLGGYAATISHTCDNPSRTSAAATATSHSVAFGWPTLTWVSHTVFLLSSMQYQIRLDPVTSYCHCSISTPPIRPTRGAPLSRFCLALRRRGSAVSASHAARALEGDSRQRCSHPLADALSW